MHRAQKAGYHHDVILAGRRINDSIGVRVACECLRRLLKAGTPRPRVTVLGLTFKENVVDVRNSQVFDIIREFQSFGVTVQVHDPLADSAAALKEYGVTLQKEPTPADAVVLAVAHDSYRASGWPLITRLLVDGRGLVMESKACSIRVQSPQASRFGGSDQLTFVSAGARLDVLWSAPAEWSRRAPRSAHQPTSSFPKSRTICEFWYNSVNIRRRNADAVPGDRDARFKSRRACEQAERTADQR